MGAILVLMWDLARIAIALIIEALASALQSLVARCRARRAKGGLLGLAVLPILVPLNLAESLWAYFDSYVEVRRVMRPESFDTLSDCEGCGDE